MSTAQQVIYADKFVAGFEAGQSVLRQTVTTQTIAKGGQFYFLIASSGGAEAVTRGSNGLIPARDDSQTQVPVTLAEAHDLQRKTGFNVFRGQADQQAIMQMTGMKVINRKIDRLIISQLATATVTTGAAQTFSKTMVNKGLTKLGNAFAFEDMEGEVFGALTPAAWMYATDITAFANSLYTTANKDAVDKGMPRPMERAQWMGVTWHKVSILPGAATNAAQCFLWHRNAIGHAVDTASIQAMIARNEEHDYSYARHTIYQGSAVLQNAGIVVMNHDDSQLS